MDTSLRTITATRGDAGERIDLVVRRHLADVGHATRTRVQQWIRDGAVTVNGRHATRPAARAACGDLIRVMVPPGGTRTVMTPEVSDLDVVFEDGHFLVVNKPPGIVVHPTYRNVTGTLMNGLLWRARRWPAGQRPSLVGRLDKLTSGLVLVAKTPRVHAALQRTLAHAVSEKSYLALVFGRPPAQGVIQLRLSRDTRDRRRVVASTVHGASSLTRFERVAHAAPRPRLALLQCRLMTGRMHQIRVHLSALGWPLVGDPVYGEPRWTEATDPGLAAALRDFPRQALHAWRISFPHPLTGEPVRVHAPLAPDFSRLLEVCGLTPPRS